MKITGVVGASVKGLLVGTGFLKAAFKKMSGKDEGMSFAKSFGMHTCQGVMDFLEGVGEGANRHIAVGAGSVEALSSGRRQVSAFLGMEDNEDAEKPAVSSGRQVVVTQDAVIIDGNIVVPLTGHADGYEEAPLVDEQEYAI